MSKYAELMYEAPVDDETWTVPDRYQDLHRIGVGAFGTVTSALDIESGKRVAIKKLYQPLSHSFRARQAYRELTILGQMHHENVIAMHDLYTPDDSARTLKSIYFVSTLMEVDLEYVLHTQQLSVDHTCFLMYQLLRGLKYIHSSGIIHRDLKPNNIGLNSNCELRILDFGQARWQDTRMTAYVSMRWYRAPEIMYNWTSYGNTVDVWSAGCILAEMFTGKVLFRGKDQMDQFWRIVNVLGTPEDHLLNKMHSAAARAYIRSFPEISQPDWTALFPEIPATALDLMWNMLVWDADNRLSVSQALVHPYFSKYHDAKDEPTSPYKIELTADDVDYALPKWRQMLWQVIEDFQKNSSQSTSTISNTSSDTDASSN